VAQVLRLAWVALVAFWRLVARWVKRLRLWAVQVA
jgi:hypothetical protein